MSKEKIKSLTRYVEDMKGKLTSPVPEKHKNGPAQYKAFLNNEIRMASLKLEALKFAPEATPAKK